MNEHFPAEWFTSCSRNFQLGYTPKLTTFRGSTWFWFGSILGSNQARKRSFCVLKKTFTFDFGFGFTLGIETLEQEKNSENNKFSNTIYQFFYKLVISIAILTKTSLKTTFNLKSIKFGDKMSHAYKLGVRTVRFGSLLKNVRFQFFSFQFEFISISVFPILSLSLENFAQINKFWPKPFC